MPTLAFYDSFQFSIVTGAGERASRLAAQGGVSGLVRSGESAGADMLRGERGAGLVAGARDDRVVGEAWGVVYWRVRGLLGVRAEGDAGAARCAGR